ncbi:ABC transporter permease [Ensifer sp. ENS09]|uniref:ABC transporter permease n=1 Tax=Ensifer sp. ENS09 TaxID=2769263 RepID=UPI00177FBEC0|nr:ABC transporter permease [Ensifer sp. ENS09]MBD9650320.1 ABC transporter permease [Ensifer sp. ENS09]
MTIMIEQTTVRPMPKWQAVLRSIRGNPPLAIGFCILVAIVLAAIFADWISPFDPLRANPLERYKGILSGWNILGTDELGRDILSRLIHGTRYALLVAIVPTVIALVLGGLLGMVSGYVGGFLDATIMRFFDVMFAFPGILLALGISAALGPGLSSMIIAMVVVTVPAFGRIIRGAVLQVKEEVFIEASHALGFRSRRIAFRHILPNILGPAIVYGTLQTGRNVILSSSLSFLGLGPQPPTPEWGQMLSSGRAALATAAHVATVPGLAIVILAVAFNLIGDGARDYLDPRFNKQRD